MMQGKWFLKLLCHFLSHVHQMYIQQLKTGKEKIRLLESVNMGPLHLGFLRRQKRRDRVISQSEEIILAQECVMSQHYLVVCRVKEYFSEVAKQKCLDRTSNDSWLPAFIFAILLGSTFRVTLPALLLISYQMCTPKPHNGTNVTDEETVTLYVSNGKTSLCCHLGKWHLGIIFHRLFANYLLKVLQILENKRLLGFSSVNSRNTNQIHILNC